MTPPVINVQTDLSALQDRIELPPNVSAAKWVVLPLGSVETRVPGPTDTILYAALSHTDGDWSALPKVENLLSSQRRIKLPMPVAEVLLSPASFEQFSQVGDALEVMGERYDPSVFNQGSYRGLYAVEVDGYLLVCLQSL